MSTIDEKVVTAKFDNKQFLEGVSSTLSAVDRLNKGMNFQGAGRGIESIATAAGKVTHKIDVMRIALVTAIGTIAHQATIAGERLVSAFTLDPIKAGFQNYETQINAIQTILANTGLKGKQGLSQVNTVLAQLNEYANKTVYNFSEMAKNIGTFTAAGVKLKPAAESIKGIANLAALSGSNSQQASTAMYQLSQAIAANQVKLQDWNSVVNAGIGGKVFQKALFATGQALHTIKNAKVGESFEQWTKAGNTFRGSLKDGWITGKVLTQTLAGFTGDLTEAQLKSMGYNAEQIKQIREMGKTAVNAATQIKTLSQMGQALKEEVATAYSTIFKTIFGNITKATATFSGLHNVLQNALTGPIYKFNKILEGWSKMGGRTAAIQAFKYAWQDLAAVLKPIRQALHQIFPPADAETLFNITIAIRNLAERLKIGGDTAKELKRTFAGVFAIFDIGRQILVGVIHFLGQLFAKAGEGSGGFLSATASIGDFLVALDKSVKKGRGVTKFFDKLAEKIKPVIGYIEHLLHLFAGLFDHVKPAEAGKKVASSFDPLAEVGRDISTVWNDIAHVLHAVWDVAKAVGTFVAGLSAKIGFALSNIFAGFHYEDFLKTINTALLGGIVLLLKKWVDHVRSPAGNPLRGLIDVFKEPFEELTGTLQQMQKTLRATTLLQIAIAVGVLAASAVALSRIDSGGLKRALTAMAVMFGQLFVSLAIFERIGGAKGLATTSSGLILFATALRILATSVTALSGLSWQEMAKGLTSVIALIGSLTLASRGLSGQGKGMIRTGAALVLLAESIKILADAVQKFSGMNWKELAKGLTSVGAVLAGLTLFTRFSEAGKLGISSGAGLILLATAIKILASAVGDFSKKSWKDLRKGLAAISGILLAVTLFSQGVGNPIKLLAASVALNAIGSSMIILSVAINKFAKLSWTQIGKGLATMAGSLGLIVGALNLMPPTSVLSAAALVGVAAALVAIGKTVQSLSGMSWTEIAKGLVTLGAALGIIAGAMALMTGAIPGAAALAVVAGSLALLVPELKIMGGMSWIGIAKGLVVLAGSFAVIGAAGALLTPVIPSLLGLGAAIALIGVGVAAAGAGVLAFSAGLAALAASGGAAVAVIIGIITGLVGALPTLTKELGLTLVAAAEVIGSAGPAITKAMAAIVDALLDVTKREAPKIIDTFGDILVHLFDKMADAVPKMADSALRMMIGILNAIDRRHDQIVNAFENVVVDILGSMTAGSPRMVAAAVDWVVSIIRGIAKNLGQIIDAGTDVVISFVNGIALAGDKIVDASFQAVIMFVNGIADAIRQNTPALYSAGLNIAAAIADGMTFGMASKVGSVAKAAASMAGSALSSAKHLLGVHSPSKEFEKIGRWVSIGFAKGIIGDKSAVIAAWQQTHDLLRAAMDNAKQDISDYTEKLKAAEKAHDSKKIDHFTAALAQARKEYEASREALATLHKHYAQDEAHLARLGVRYGEYTKQLEKANEKLQAAIQTRNDFRKQTTEQFDILPDITTDTQLPDYIKSIEQQIADTQTFAEVLQKLRKKGLSDAVYKELLSKGTAALPLAEQILAGGKAAINEVNDVSSQLAKTAKSLGKQASDTLYQAGVDAAQGLVDGLKKKRDAIAEQMRDIARELVRALKKELQIKSPSKVMEALGQFTGRGLADGIRKSLPEVTRATSILGSNTLETMKKSIRDMNTMIASEIDPSPRITPVLDLSTVKKQADGLGDVLGAKQLALAAAYSQATSASESYQQSRPIVPATDVPTQRGGDINFTQNNYSPKALPAADIYRNTKNQLSQAKGALNQSDS